MVEVTDTRRKKYTRTCQQPGLLSSPLSSFLSSFCPVFESDDGPTSAAEQNQRSYGHRAHVHRLETVRNDLDRPQERRQWVRGWLPTDRCASSSQPVNRLEKEAKEIGEPRCPTPRCPAHPAGRYSWWSASPSMDFTQGRGVSRASTASRAVGRRARARARGGQEGRAGGVHEHLTALYFEANHVLHLARRVRMHPDALREGPRPPAHPCHANPMCSPPSSPLSAVPCSLWSHPPKAPPRDSSSQLALRNETVRNSSTVQGVSNRL